MCIGIIFEVILLVCGRTRAKVWTPGHGARRIDHWAKWAGRACHQKHRNSVASVAYNICYFSITLCIWKLTQSDYMNSSWWKLVIQLVAFIYGVGCNLQATHHLGRNCTNGCLISFWLVEELLSSYTEIYREIGCLFYMLKLCLIFPVLKLFFSLSCTLLNMFLTYQLISS